MGIFHVNRLFFFRVAIHKQYSDNLQPAWLAVSTNFPAPQVAGTDTSNGTTQYQSTILLHQSLNFYSCFQLLFMPKSTNFQHAIGSDQEEAPVAAPVQVLPPETLLAAGASKASAPAPPGEAGGAGDTAPAMAMPGAAMPGAAGVPMPGAAAAAAAMMPGGDPFDLKRPGKTHGK